MNGSTSHQELACRVLRGDQGTFTLPPEQSVQFLQYTRDHGVQPLLYARLKAARAWEGWPAEVHEALAAGAASQAVLDVIQSQETASVVEALGGRRVAPLLIKGAALAHTHYASPHLRPRGDTDMLIRRDDREAARSVLADLGYKRRHATSGELVSYQEGWSRVGSLGVAHVIDLHWEVNNRQMFAEALSYDELASGSVPLPGLNARAPGPVHALLLACMHRVAHIAAPWWTASGRFQYGDRLIWLYDVHLLASQMLRHELTQFSRLAAQRRLRTVCFDGLTQTHACFGTILPAAATVELSRAHPPERSALYLQPGRLRSIVSDIRSLPAWRDRLRLAKEHLFPPAEYLKHKYAVSRSALIPALYVRRGMQGLWRMLRH